MIRRTKLAWLLGALFAVLAIGVGIWIAIRSAEPAGREVNTPSPTTSVARGDDEDQAARVASALGQLNDDPALLVPDDLQSEIGPLISEAIPDGYVAEPLQSTWAPGPGDSGVMTVQLTAAGRPTLSFAVVVEEQDSGWKVLGTFDLDEGFH